MPNPGDYQVEYAKSGRSKCNITSKNIPNGALRIGLYYESEYGVIAKWYDFEAFEKDASKVNDLRSSGAKIIGLSDLKAKDKQRVEQLTAGFIATTAVPMVAPPMQQGPPVLAMPAPILPTSLPSLPSISVPNVIATPSYGAAKKYNTPKAKKVTPPKKFNNYKKKSYESDDEADDFIDDDEEEEEASAEDDSAEEEEEEEEEEDNYRGRGRYNARNNYARTKTAKIPAPSAATVDLSSTSLFATASPFNYVAPQPAPPLNVSFGTSTVFGNINTTNSAASFSTFDTPKQEVRTNKQISAGTKRPHESDSDDSDLETMAGVYDQVEKSSKKRRKLVQKSVSKLTPGDFNMSFLQYMARSCPPNYSQLQQFEDWCPTLDQFETRVKDLNGAEIQLLLARLINQWKRSGQQEQISKLKRAAMQIIQERNATEVVPK